MAASAFPWDVLALQRESGWYVVRRGRRRSDGILGDVLSFVPPARFDDGDEWQPAFQAMVSALTSLRHQHVASVYDIGADPEGGPRLWYVAQEYVSDRTLAMLLQAGPLDVDRVLDIAARLASALARGHEDGLWWGHLDPGEVLIDDVRSPSVKLGCIGSIYVAMETMGSCDAAALVQRSDDGRPEQLLWRLAPEQLGWRRPGRRVPPGPMSDVYLLGALTYRMLEGQFPLAWLGPPDALAFLIYETAPLDLPFTRNEPEPLRRLLESMLRRDPEARPRMREVEEAVRIIAGTSELS